jgi:hypothetical protein
MSHPPFEDLMAFSDGEMDGAAAQKLRDHLAACVECRAVIESQRHMETAWRGSFVEPSEAEFDRLERSISGRMVRKPFYIRALPVAAALLVALAGVRLMSSERGLLSRREAVPVHAMTDAAPETVLVTASAEPDFQRIPADSPAAFTEQAVAGQADDVSQAGRDAWLDDGVATVSPGAEEAGDQQSQAGYGGIAGLLQPASGAGGGSGTLEVDLDAASVQSPSVVDEGQAGGVLSSAEASGNATGSLSATGSDAEGYSVDLTGAIEAGGEASGVGGACRSTTAEGAAEAIAARTRVEDNRVFEPETAPEACDATLDPAGSTCLEILSGESQEASSTLPACAMAFFSPKEVAFRFDSLGNPTSPDSLLLDEGFEGWKDSVEGRFVDSVVVVQFKELPEFLE